MKQKSNSENRKINKEAELSIIEKYFASIDIAIIGTDNENKIIFWNTASEKMLGWQGNETIGKLYNQIIHTTEDNSDYYKTFEKTQRDGNSFSERVTLISKAKDQCIVLIKHTPVKDDHNNVIGTVILIRGLSEEIKIEEDREKALTELMKSELQFRELLSGLPDIVLIHQNGNIVYANQMACDKTGFSENELIGTNVLEHVFQDDRTIVISNMRNRLDKNRIPDYEIRTVEKGGIIRNVIVRTSEINFNGTPSVIIILIDITDRKKAEDKLKNQKDQLLEVHRLGNLASFDWNLKTDEIIWSPQFFSMVERQADSFPHTGKFFFTLVHPDDIDRLKNAIDNSIKEKKKISVEYNIVMPNGRTKHIVSLCEVKYSSDNNTPVSLFGYTQDITERKRAELALTESEEKFRQLAEATPFAIMIYQNDKFIYTNPAGEEISGYKAEELYKMKYWDFVSPEYRDTIKSRGAKRQEGETDIPSSYEFSIISKNGKKKWVLFNGCLIKLKGKPAGLIAVTDITERKEAEVAFRESEYRFISFMNYLPAAAFIKDAEGRTLYVNKMNIDTFGNENWVGKLTEEIMTADAAKAMREDDIHALKKGYQKREELRVHHDGAIHVHETQKFAIIRPDNPPLLGGISLDITERKLSEEAVKNSENLFRSIWESSKDGMRLTDENGIIVKVNNAYCMAFGKIREELEGKNFNEIYDEMDKNRVLSSYLKNYNEKKIDRFLDRKYTLWNGKEIWLSVSSNLINMNNSKPLVLSIFRDITSQKETEEEIRQSEDMLYKLNAEKDKLFSIIAHDLRSPFQGFLGLTQMLMDEYQEFSPDELFDGIKTLNKSATNLFKLLENLLEWSRFKRGLAEFRPEILDLYLTVNQNIELILNTAGQKGIEIVSEISSGTKVYADEKMLNTILRNLISNAVKFTKRNGKVTISCSAEGENRISISVTDTGIGIPPQILDKLFKIDERVNTRGTDGEQSTGLGLFLCKEFVEKHDGKIEIISSEGKGSTFIFTLLKG